MVKSEKAMGNEDLYLAATNEVESSQRDLALWAKSLALTEGDEGKAKFKYINLRIEQLSDRSTKNISSEESLESTNKYPWKSVLIWILIIFVAGFVGIKPPGGSYGNTDIAFKIVSALVLAVLGGGVIGAVKYFRR